MRNARVATASDTFDADIGIRDGRIVQLGLGLPAGAARDRRRRARSSRPAASTPIAISTSRWKPPVRMADDFDTGTRSAACGGTTTVIPFAAQQKGQSLRAAVRRLPRSAPKAARTSTTPST